MWVEIRNSSEKLGEPHIGESCELEELETGVRGFENKILYFFKHYLLCTYVGLAFRGPDQEWLHALVLAHYAAYICDD